MISNYWLHSREVLYRINYSLLGFIVTFCTSYNFSDIFLYRNAINCSNHFLCTNLSEALLTFITISLFISCYIWLPFAIYSILSFFVSGLYRYEKIRLLSNFLIIILLIYISLIVAQYLIIPLFYNFFIESSNIGNSIFKLEISPRIASFQSMCSRIYILLNIIVLVPYYIVYFAIAINRKWLYILSLIFSSMLSPPDFVIQSFMSVLIVSLVEFSVFVIIITKKYKNIKI